MRPWADPGPGTVPSTVCNSRPCCSGWERPSKSSYKENEVLTDKVRGSQTAYKPTAERLKIFSAAMSSIDSGMNSISTVFVTDIYRRFIPDKSEHSYFILARWITLLSGIFASAIALIMVSFDIKSATLFSAAVVGLFSSGLAGLFALGIFTRRAKGIGAFIGAIASALFLYFIKYHTPIHFFLYTIIGFFICLSVGYLASLIIPEKEKPLEGLTLYTLNRKK